MAISREILLKQQKAFQEHYRLFEYYTADHYHYNFHRGDKKVWSFNEKNPKPKWVKLFYDIKNPEECLFLVTPDNKYPVCFRVKKDTFA